MKGHFIIVVNLLRLNCRKQLVDDNDDDDELIDDDSTYPLMIVEACVTASARVLFAY